MGMTYVIQWTLPTYDGRCIMHDGRRGNKPTERALHDVFGALGWVAGLVKLQRLRHQLARDDDLRHREFSVQNIQSQPGADMSVDLFSERGLGF